MLYSLHAEPWLLTSCFICKTPLPNWLLLLCLLCLLLLLLWPLMG